MSRKNLAEIAILSVQLSILLPGVHARDKEPGEISVQVIDQVGLPEKEWRLAQQTAGKLFQSAGLSVNWVHCLWNPNTASGNCPQAATPDKLNLVMVSEQTAMRLQAPARVFGTALMAPEGSFGSRGYIYYGRIQSKCAEEHDINEALLLGAIIAHELGHLLLGPNSHSPTGIMKPDLERSDMTGTPLAWLRFSDRQRETLRTAVARRLEAAHSNAMNANSFIAKATAPSAAR